MTKSNQHQLYFIALLPPQETQKLANQIKQHFAEVYNSRAAQKSPPHITLQPPFEWQKEELSTLIDKLSKFTQSQFPIPIILDGFAAFKPRVIYINVLKTPELLKLQQELTSYLELYIGIVHQSAKKYPFTPHLTVAFHDLTKQNFYKAWTEFKQQQLHFQFIVPQLTLLIHNGKSWEIKQEFPLTAI